MQPAGTLTFLVTDIEGSTRLWEAHPEVMSEAVAWHDGMLAEVIEDRGGHVVKTTGDGVLAVFTSAAAAVAAAVHAQLALDEREFPEIGRLAVRMGINTGEAYERDGDYFGTAINRTARIMGAAAGGQILVSDATSLLARTDAWETIELGEVALRGLAEPERVHQVAAPGLRRVFAPLDTGRGFPNNLPAPPTDFIGRGRDIEAGTRLLAAGRLVSITGPGGIGKTRLALELATRAGGHFDDGVWFVDLAAATGDEHVVEAVAAALRVVEEPSRSLADGIGAYLGGRTALLVLDNCEQVLGAVRELAESWLQAAPRLRILATSRERLGAAGESVWLLGPLGPGEAFGDEAVQLFIARAEAVNPHLDLAPHADAIEALCRELDGIPLAIELAAARVSALSPSQIRERLDSHFRILRRRGDRHRHGSLHAAIEWSHDLLSPGEARLFAALAVFAGGFDLAAAEELAGVAGVETADVVDLVASLVDKSLVVSEAGAGEPRYRYLETLRRFALGRLAEADRIAARDAQARWAQRLVGDDIALLETEQEAWETRLRERRNLDQALEWLVERGDARGAAQVAAGLNSVWQWLAYRDGLGWYRRIIAMPGLAPADRLVMLCSAAWLEWSFGDPKAASAMVGEAQDIADAHGLVLPLQGIAVLVVIAAFDDRPERAIELATEALAQATTREGDAEVAAATLALVWAYVSVGRFEEADDVAAQALPFARTTGNESMLTIALMGLAVAKRAVEPERALELLDEAVAMAGASGARWHLAAATLHRGYCWLLLGDAARGMGEFGAAARLAYEVGDHRACCSAMEAVASFAARSGRPEDAVRLFAGAARMRAELTGVAGLRVEVTHRNRLLEGLRAELGGVFDDLWAEAQALAFPTLVEAAARLGGELAGGSAGRAVAAVPPVPPGDEGA